MSKPMSATRVAPDRGLDAATTSPPAKPQQLLYTSVRDRILANLATGGLRPGQRYYTEGELAERYGVSRNTVRRAMAELEEQGYLRRQRGLGSLVKRLPGPPQAPQPESRATSSPSTNTHNRLVVVLPEWDDSTEGFYAARILRELTAPDPEHRWTIEIRHSTDPLDLEVAAGLSVLAMDPWPALTVHLHTLAEQGVPILVTAPSDPFPVAVNLCDALSDTTREAVKHFHSLGHQRVGILIPDIRHHDFQQMLTGFLDAHRELALPVHPHAIVQHFQRLHGPSKVDAREITAWVASFAGAVDTIVDACAQHGLTIPDDVSLLCFDDPGPRRIGDSGKQLSVIRSDAVQTAKVVRSCLHHWAENLRGQVIDVPMQWVDRETIAAPRDAHGV